MPINDFRIQCPESDTPESRKLYQEVTTQRFPNSSPLVYVDYSSNPKGQLSGKDASFYEKGREFFIQFKLRRKTYRDLVAYIAIEDKHTYYSGRSPKNGWAREDSQADYIIYIQGMDRWSAAFAWEKFKQRIDENIDGKNWAQYPLLPALNRGYQTWNRLVPAVEFADIALDKYPGYSKCSKLGF